jgi:hypothetical protein
MPIVMGGAYTLFNQLTAHASVFVSIHLYVASGNDHLPARVLWIAGGALLAAWAVTYGAAMYMVKPQWRSSFYSTETCVDYTHATFYDVKDDEHRMAVFDFHEVKYAAFKDELRAWTHANWFRWKREGEPWFNDELIARVPDEFIPFAEIAALNAAAHGGKRRRSSFGLIGVTESVRRGSQGEAIVISA